MSTQLSPEQLQAFNNQSSKLGVEPETAPIVTSGTKNVISSDPAESHFPLKQVKATSISQFKDLMGYGQHGPLPTVQYPKPLQETTLGSAITAGTQTASNPNESDAKELNKAATAYILGDSSKVNDYEPIINQQIFPRAAGVIACQNMTITSTNPLMVNTTQTAHINVGNLTFEPGAFIEIQADVSITVQKVNGDADFRIGLPPIADAAAATGSTGQTGSQGTKGTDGAFGMVRSTSIWLPVLGCKAQPTNGGKGGQGSEGGQGGNGLNGNPGPTVNLSLGECTGNIKLSVHGQDGQKGGTGGTGGLGGPGGAPGNNAPLCNAAQNGPQGEGGPGGPGGQGGSGGDGPNVMLSYSSLAGQLTKNIQVGNAAPGGDKGIGGHGIPNGPDGTVGKTGIHSGREPYISVQIIQS